jgi:signal transduction histidine kinase
VAEWQEEKDELMVPNDDVRSPCTSDLRARICIALAAMSIVGMALLTVILYGHFRVGLRHGVRERLRDIVSLAARQVDAAAHNALTAPKDEGNETYLRLRTDLQQIRDAATDVRFVYTMRRGPANEIVFVVDAETNPDEIAHLGEIYTEPGAALQREFATLTGPMVEDEFYTDKWGTWLSGYAPLYTAEGKRVGTIGMDIAASEVLAGERRFLFASFALFAATIPFLFLSSSALSGRLSAATARAQKALTRRVASERLISKVSSSLVQLDMAELDKGVECALSTIGAFTRTDRAYVFLFKDDGTRMDNTHEWCADGIEPEIEHLQDIAVDKELPWFARCIRNGDVCHVPDVTALPPEARPEREHFEAQGIQSLIVLPVAAEERLLGFLGFDAVRERRCWSADDQAMLGLVGECFAHVIARKQLEERLRQSEKMGVIGQLAGGVAHEFNNMLEVIIGYTELTLGDQDLAPSLHADLQEVLKAARRSACLTSQLLTFARKQVISPRVLDLNETVEMTLKILERLTGENIELTWQPCEGLWPVLMDPSQIDQILTNLCVNARDAVGDVGAVRIALKNAILDETGCIEHAAPSPGEYVLLSVSDNGCGMDRETVERIFEPFFTTKEIGKGTGLGLAAVYGIVQQNAGGASVRSEPGLGTTFEIYLPRHVGAASVVTNGGGAVLRGTETVLVVEDEPAVLRIAKRMLGKQGYRVLTAATPGEATRLVTAHASEIRLLITDVIMPETNGQDLAKSLLRLRPGLKCLFMSGYTADVIAQNGVFKEGTWFIQKPFSSRELGTKVREVLDAS